eukprot:CAMPEP_0119101254 /NCGR_PEP_ID=MMETSP1180-20130426/350_1 /TAXON_ID=3052 ORGANISM="Chlamydomonas cf sp, Strain CCMP681" /NCGR_SAMPLE_ID=MMETSP1180 /ASSEMBLY_ACC=CAM_ASM_000741 /LENGTH=190 /DNA_ID=CAMNT_0007085349 /DNA_START=49 /DNA_END=621 /DNA_ORIENTATION=+
MNALRMKSAQRAGVAHAPSRSTQRTPLVLRRAEPEKQAEPSAQDSLPYAGKSFSQSMSSVDDPASIKPIAAAAPAAAAVAVQPTFNEVMGFSGSPEIINGRLAMLGFVAAIGAELSSGESVLRQISVEPTGIALVFVLFIAASLVPAFQRSKASLGPFTPGAELTNGRAAMIGFAAMLIIEAVRGVPLLG